VFAAFKHEVLKEVGKTGAMRLLILGPHAVEDVHHGFGYGMVFMNENFQTIVEGMSLI